MAFDVGAIVATLELRKDQWEQSIRKVKADQKSLSGMVLRNSAQFRQMGRTMTIAGAAIVGSFGLMVKSAVGFNKEMANVATLIPGQSERIIELKKDVQDLAMAYGKSTSDISGGLYQVISAFGDASDTAKKLEINVMAAAAGLATTTDAINLTSAVTKAYGDVSAEAVQKVADLAFLTVKLGQTTFPELAASIGMVTPQMEAMGVQQEELFAGFATLTGVTGNAAIVSTQLKGILNAMMKPSEFMAKSIKKLGFETSKAMVKELGMVGALRELIKTTDGTNEQIGKLFPNIRALPGVFALAGAQADTFDEKLKAMGDRIGTLDEAFNEISKGINQAGFDMERLKMMTIVLSQRLGDSLAPMLGKIAVGVGKAVKAVSEWIKEHPGLTEVIVKSTLAIGVLLTVLGPLIIILPSIAAGMVLIEKSATLMNIKIKVLTATKKAWAAVNAKLGLSFKMLLGPIGLVIVAAGVAHIAISKLTKAYIEKQDAEMAAMVKSTEPLAQATALRKRLIAEEIVTVDEWSAIYHKHGKSWKRVMQAISKLPEYAHIKEKWEEMQADISKTSKVGRDVWTRFAMMVKKIKESTENVASLVKDMTDEIKKATLSEYEYSKWAAKQTYEERKKFLEDEGANKTAFVLLEKAHAIELNGIEKGRTKTLKTQWQERGAAITAGLAAWYRSEKTTREEIQALHAGYIDYIKELTLSEKEYRLGVLDEWYAAELEKLGKNLDAKAALLELYNLRKAGIEKDYALTSVDIAMGLGSVLTALAGKNKVLAIAGAIISTYAGAAKTLATLGMPLAIPYIAMAIASGLGQVASIMAVPVPSAEKGAYLPSPAIIEAGHGPLGEVILPLDRAPLEFTKETSNITKGSFVVDLNFYAPLISTTGLSERDMDRASEYMLEKMKREIERYGGKLNA